jgi:fatty acid CoA ligase FadD32
LRTGFVAAFSVPANQLPQEVFDNPHIGLTYDPDDTSEQLVIVAERAAGAHKLEYQPIVDDIRAAIAIRHGVTVRDVLLVQPGTIPRTSSGKIGHRACREAYINNSLRRGVASPTAFAGESN